MKKYIIVEINIPDDNQEDAVQVFSDTVVSILGIGCLKYITGTIKHLKSIGVENVESDENYISAINKTEIANTLRPVGEINLTDIFNIKNILE